MGQIKVTSSVLRQKADELEQLNSILNSKIDELNAVGRELSQQWQGDANRAFQVMFQRDIQQFIQFKLVINSYIINLRLMAARYDQAESKNVALVGGGSTYPGTQSYPNNQRNGFFIGIDPKEIFKLHLVLKYGSPLWTGDKLLIDFKNSLNDFKVAWAAPMLNVIEKDYWTI